jgi:NAD(P)-dependent dehydrogenase (short-subunit alcohol dehydrogenase family)
MTSREGAEAFSALGLAPHAGRTQTGSMPTALVTGCSTGIGFATALRLASDGFEVVATMRNPNQDGDRLLSTAATTGVAVELLELDVDDDSSVAAAFSRAGEVDVLVNNAGVVVYGSVEETAIDDWHRVVSTNLLGAVRCMRAVMPGMRRRGGGCIVNVSTIGARASLPGMGAYFASKAALEAMSEAAAIEGEPHGIRVVVVEPGAIQTALVDKAPPVPKGGPYWPTMRNSFVWLGAAFAAPSDADTVAASISSAISDELTPFRVTTGRLSAETVRLRETTPDDAWRAMLSSPTRTFIERYEELSGMRLAD